MAMTLSSPAFPEGERIPERYACDGENVSPPLVFGAVPPEAASLALIMEDPDVPKELHPEGVWDHWVVFNIPAEAREAGEGDALGTPGKNSRGSLRYAGPCPPPQYEPREHRYFFRLYALDTMLVLLEGATKDEVLEAMKGHVLQTAELMGRYSREEKTRAK